MVINSSVYQREKEPRLPTRRTGQGAEERLGSAEDGKSYTLLPTTDSTQTYPNNSASVC